MTLPSSATVGDAQITIELGAGGIQIVTLAMGWHVITLGSGPDREEALERADTLLSAWWRGVLALRRCPEGGLLGLLSGDRPDQIVCRHCHRRFPGSVLHPILPEHTQGEA